MVRSGSASSVLGVLVCSIFGGTAWSNGLGAELLAAARTSVQATDARRHVAALADDAFEGREGGSRGGRAAGAYIVAHLEKLGFEPVGDDGSYYQQFGGMRNILALVRGSGADVNDELVVVGAHYDHVGYGNAANSYGPFGFVHNGADDNASGVAGLLEIAEALQLMPRRPRRSILLAFWDGEEKGLLGSYHFLRVRPSRLASLKIVFAVNIDMIGRLRGERLEVYGTRTATGLRSEIVSVNNRPQSTPLELSFDWAIEDDSDHYPFIAAKIPTIMFHTGLHDQYHRPSDDVDLVNFGGIEPVTRLILDFVTSVAEDPGPVRAFRAECRNESNATKRAIEAIAGVAPAPTGTTAPRPRWGIGTRADPGEPSAPVVVRVTSGSPAATAGLVVGDRVVAIDAAGVSGQDDMVSRLAAAGESVVIDVERKGKMMQLTLRLDQPNDARGN